MIILKSRLPSIRKRSFLLFELLLSLALLTLCLFPLLQPHLGIEKKQREWLEWIQLERCSKAAICKIKEQLSEGTTWSWGSFSKKILGKLEHPAEVYVGKKEPLLYPVSYTLRKTDFSTGKNGAISLRVDVYFTSKQQKKIGPFSHSFFLQGEPIQ